MFIVHNCCFPWFYVILNLDLRVMNRKNKQNEDISLGFKNSNKSPVKLWAAFSFKNKSYSLLR